MDALRRNVSTPPVLIEVNYDLISTEELLQQFQSDLNTGLTTSRIESAHQQYGFNEIPEKKPQPILKFLKKFWGVTAWILEFIILLSIYLQNWENIIMVIGLLLMNAILGFFQEEKASKAVEALKMRLQINAKVLRETSWLEVPARELVPGDIIRIRTGDMIPADIKIINGDVGVDQSALTGESLELDRGAEEILFQGSIIRRGEATGIVIRTGVYTFYGKTTMLVQIARPVMTLEKIVGRVVTWLMIIVIVLLIVVVIDSLFQGKSLLDTLPLLLVLFLSAIPVALPIMFTVTVSLGSQTLSRKGVLVTRLNASEDAATMTVLCSDKTGTLTMNQLTIVMIHPWGDLQEKDVLLYGASASQEANHDPIDDAFLKAAADHQVLTSAIIQKQFIPFDVKWRRTEAVVEQDGQEFLVMKGAVNTLIELCQLTKEDISSINMVLDEWAQKGYRTLAVALQHGEDTPQFIGLVAIYDLPRPDSHLAIEKLGQLGVSVKMLTGDSEVIAKEVASIVGLGSNITKMSAIKELVQSNPAQITQIIKQSDVFAEIYPEDKYLIVEQLQKSGQIVGMTGDGVNDAPALKQAEVGIAVSNATDVAKGAASVVLINEGLIGTIELVKEGRLIYKRIITWILSKIVRNIFNNVLIVFMFLVTGEYIASAFAMVLILFMTDFVKIAIATDNVQGSETPNSWDISGVNKVGIILGTLIFVELALLLGIGFEFFNLGTNYALLVSFTFGAILYADIISFFNVREKRFFWKSRPSNTLLYGLILDFIAGTIILLIGIPGLVSIPSNILLFMILYIAICLLGLNEVTKVFLVKHFHLHW